jgi:hypothetical protein
VGTRLLQQQWQQWGSLASESEHCQCVTSKFK